MPRKVEFTATEVVVDGQYVAVRLADGSLIMQDDDGQLWALEPTVL